MEVTEKRTEAGSLKARLDGYVKDDSFVVYNPANLEKLAELPVRSAAEVAQAVERARLAQQEWASLDFKARRDIMRRWQSKLMTNKDRIVDTLVAENGKTRMEALIELVYIADVIGYYSAKAAKYLKDQKVSLHLLKHKRALVTYHPFGVVG